MTFTLGSASAAPAPEQAAGSLYPPPADRSNERNNEWQIARRDSFNQLQRESGYTLEDDTVTQFRESVLSGEWAEVERGPGVYRRRGAVDAQCKLPTALAASPPPHSARFTIKRQQFLELLEARRLKQALLVLQNELSALTDDIPQLHRLSSLLMCPSPADLYTASSWDGCQGRSRFQVLESLQAFISPRRMVPAHRMETLFKQSIRSQEANCEHHTSKGPAQPVHRPHVLCRAVPAPPAHLTARPQQRSVRRATSRASYGAPPITRLCTGLEGHTGKISYLSWSPDSEYLVSASDDKKLLLWDVHSGKLRHTFTGHTETITACRWLSDGERFLSAGMDKKIIMWSAKGHKLKHIDTPRVHDIAISSDDKTMVVADDRENVYIYDLASVTLKHKLKETAGIMSLSLTADSRYCLVGLFKGELHLWDLRTQVVPIVIRSGFAGVDDRFVVVGSEDSLVFVWNRNTGNLLARLKGHARTVNGFAWSTGLAALATISDDKTICLHVTIGPLPDPPLHQSVGLCRQRARIRRRPSPALSQHTDEHDREEEEDDDEDDDEGEEDEEEYGLRSRRHDSSDEGRRVHVFRLWEEIPAWKARRPAPVAFCPSTDIVIFLVSSKHIPLFFPHSGIHMCTADPGCLFANTALLVSVVSQ
ncbi:WD40 repeat-like protein [Linderina pennispora]|uniref:WD40 repeat-like protein n=1 Tax=Linderina pennispora TaxID=61395 RepID=A0A1Y1WCV0_9FUNG|nr:WD40 repeat-like protein [Linderina pennispora]ORX71360.1 WD40 repeat-like protein [Linderina pennispora]